MTIQRKDLDNLKTKQDFLRPKELTEEQQLRLRKATQVEREQFKHKPALTEKDIQKLAKVELTEHRYIAKPVERPFLNIEMKTLLDEIEQRFSKTCPKGFYIIVSLTRTAAETSKLNPKIALDDTHVKGEAIDFAGKFMLKHFPDYAEALKNILIEMKKEGKIHFIDETETTAFWHVARNLK